MRARGRTAQGNNLLVSALHSLKELDEGAALRALKRFSQIPDLSSEYEQIIQIACSKLNCSGILSWASLKLVWRLTSWLL